jgi:hypothetical protein
MAMRDVQLTNMTLVSDNSQLRAELHLRDAAFDTAKCFQQVTEVSGVRYWVPELHVRF